MLRGINLGPTRRVAMADLRALLTEAGYDDVRTHLQSGNVVLASSAPAATLQQEAHQLISERFGFDVPVISRTRAQLARVVSLNPLGDVAANPKRYQVSFLAQAPDAATIARLEAAAIAPERFAAHGRELYAWHPGGVARSKLWNALADKRLGIAATARNWTTVETLLAMTEE